MKVTLPPTSPGLRVGLFGGSFNPPHYGHLMLAQFAMRRLGLDQVWWLVTPGNRLKSVDELPTQQYRMAQCHALVGRNRRMVITGIEAEIGTS